MSWCEVAFQSAQTSNGLVICWLIQEAHVAGKHTGLSVFLFFFCFVSSSPETVGDPAPTLQGDNQDTVSGGGAYDVTTKDPFQDMTERSFTYDYEDTTHPQTMEEEEGKIWRLHWNLFDRLIISPFSHSQPSNLALFLPTFGLCKTQKFFPGSKLNTNLPQPGLSATNKAVQIISLCIFILFVFI